MMGPIIIRETGVSGRKILSRKRAIRVAANKPALEHWHRLYRPEHFKNLATKKYGYAPRDGERGRLKFSSTGRTRFRSSYTGRKLARFGHTRPLEKTGAARRGSSIRRFVAQTKKAKLVMPRATAFNFWSPKSPVRMRDEFLTITPGEDAVMVRYYAAALNKAIRGMRANRVTVIR